MLWKKLFAIKRRYPASGARCGPPVSRSITFALPLGFGDHAPMPSQPLHRLPSDLRLALQEQKDSLMVWKSLTPLARNEWICWVTSAKQAATRGRRIQRAVEDLEAGKRRPCCWPGCPHRRPSALKWFKQPGK